MARIVVVAIFVVVVALTALTALDRLAHAPGPLSDKRSDLQTSQIKVRDRDQTRHLKLRYVSVLVIEVYESYA